MGTADETDQPPRRGGNRPHLRPGRRRQIQLRLGDGEYAAIAAAAADADLTPTGYTAQIVLATAREAADDEQNSPTIRRGRTAQLQRELFAARIALIDAVTELRAVEARDAGTTTAAAVQTLTSRCADAVQRLDTLIADIDRSLR